LFNLLLHTLHQGDAVSPQWLTQFHWQAPVLRQFQDTSQVATGIQQAFTYGMNIASFA
jgi:hypothetical protein